MAFFTTNISRFLSRLAANLTIRPAYILAKGGITSYDIAKYGLGVKEALVLGQIQPGVPIWQLGADGRFPELPYIVYPGNVGKDDSLTSLIQKIGKSIPTKNHVY